jgi:SAM-dependent methyltransferase
VRSAASSPAWGAVDDVRHRLHGSSHRRVVGRRRLYAEWWKRYSKALRRTARQLREPTVRSGDFVADLYERQWLPSTAEWAKACRKRKDVLVVGHRPIFSNGWFPIEAHADLFERLVETAGARSVLEVGCGRGVNLAVLALRRPGLELRGLELTHAGVARGRELVEDPPPEILELGRAADPTDEQRGALARVRFDQGDAARMPYADKSFDFAFTCLALEQAPRAYPEIVREMARVTRRYCAFLEPFADANGPLGRAQLRSIDYFRASSREFRRLGLEPVHFTTAVPQKVHFKTGLLIAAVRDTSSG